MADPGEILQPAAALKDRAVVEAKVPVVKVLVQLIQDLHEGIEGLNRQIQEAAEAHPDFFIFVEEGLRPAKLHESRAVREWRIDTLSPLFSG